MVKKSLKAKDDSKANVTRVKAKDDRVSTPKQTKAITSVGLAEPKKNILQKFVGYFKGAWFELRQVRWPNRRATFGMTAALLIFTGIFAGFILLIDLLWEYLFKLLIG